MAEFGIHLTGISITTKINHDSLIKELVQWIMPHCATSKIRRGQAILRIADIATSRKILQFTRIVRIQQLAQKRHQSESTAQLDKTRGYLFLELITTHPAINPVVRNSTLPLSSIQATIPTVSITKFKEATLSDFWQKPNLHYQRKIPISLQSVPAYSIPWLTAVDIGFLDRWYLNQLTGLNAQTAMIFNQWFTKQSLSHEDQKVVYRLITRIRNETEHQ